MRNAITTNILSSQVYNLFANGHGHPKGPCEKCGGFQYEGPPIKIKDNVYLSPREHEVFVRVHMPDKIIASLLNISVETVKKHFQNIRLKTGLNTKIELAILATQKGTYGNYN